MGCHTWSYVPMDPQPTYEECRQYVLDGIKESLDVIHEKYGADDDDIMLYFLKSYRQQLINRFGTKERALEYYDRITKKINEGRCPEAIRRRYNRVGEAMKYYKGVFYSGKHTGEILPFDIFRVYNYPEDVLTCYEDFERFWATHNCDPGIDWKTDKPRTEEEIKEIMKEFWEKHPDGIIDFG